MDGVLPAWVDIQHFNDDLENINGIMGRNAEVCSNDLHSHLFK